ncbi:hypothetical protein CEXT_7051 [Caerostris extrusa]|uniref:Uncharacterized protein n=1 Tax=Caerostris extrusa TaxID=172846 RepID=A0AAV4UAB1_CAEEX|nr:hypothetical protein CEXT_7051 [Caerostris extrusa]
MIEWRPEIEAHSHSVIIESRTAVPARKTGIGKLNPPQPSIFIYCSFRWLLPFFPSLGKKRFGADCFLSQLQHWLFAFSRYTP